METETPQSSASLKYCRDCGKQILERAEICPACGCRQAPPPRTNFFDGVSNTVGTATAGVDVGKVAMLLILNVLWNGLGNIVIGDRRGWGWGFLNWLFFIASVWMLGLPCIAFYIYCGVKGYEFLKSEATS